MTEKYVLITPAKNEESNIAKTIESVIKQTIKPLEWVIVSDGSTDNTDTIIQSYCKDYSFIKYKRNESPALKNFSSKVNAFNIGLKALDALDYSFIGNLDADISFEAGYFGEILSRFEKMSDLGVAGGLVYEVHKEKIRPLRISFNSVSGAVQLFRKECFETIGGYIPIKMGGIDSAAEICARAKGWKVQTFKELPVYHHGPVLTGNKNPVRTSYQRGYNKYLLGYHPLFHLISCISLIPQKPYLIGATCSIFGYLRAALNKKDLVLPDDVVAYLRKEQLYRLKNLCMGDSK